MTRYAYLFEARSIQQYILASGRLAEMVGASKIIDALTDETLGAALESLGFRENKNELPQDASGIAFSRREGGVFVTFLTDGIQAARLRALWTLVVQSVAPGLEWVDALTSGETFRDAVDSGYRSLAARRNLPAVHLPESTPFTRIAPRTGEPAAKRAKRNEWRDAPGVLKHEASKTDSSLRLKFLPEECHSEYSRYVFPRELTPEDESSEHAFPFLGADRNVAVIHADGNGLGLILNALKAELQRNGIDDAQYLSVYRGFSDAVRDATRNAARLATDRALLPHARISGNIRTLPARPLVLAGDDLNIIVRADLALDYAKVFLDAFESETAQALSVWKSSALGGLSIPGLPERLTACAGIVFCGANQPFASAYALSEALCKAAKQQAAQHKVGDLKPGGFIFHRVTTSFIEDWNDVVSETLTVRAGQLEARLSLGLYGVGVTASQAGLPAWTHLEQLKDILSCATLARGPVRELMLLMYQSPEIMRQRYARWRENLIKSGPGGSRQLAQIDKILVELGVKAPHVTPFTDDPIHPATPLGDVVSLLPIYRRTVSDVAPASRMESLA